MPSPKRHVIYLNYSPSGVTTDMVAPTFICPPIRWSRQSGSSPSTQITTVYRVIYPGAKSESCSRQTMLSDIKAVVPGSAPEPSEADLA